MLRLLLLCNLINVTLTQMVCNASTYVDYYFQLCLNDPQCRHNFNLYPSEKLYFETILDGEMLWTRDITWAEICASNETSSLWLADMRVQTLCLAGEIRDPIVGCRAERVGRLDSVRHHLSELGITLAWLVVTGVVVFFGVHIGRKNAKMASKIKQIHKEAKAKAVQDTSNKQSESDMEYSFSSVE